MILAGGRRRHEDPPRPLRSGAEPRRPQPRPRSSRAATTLARSAGDGVPVDARPATPPTRAVIGIAGPVVDNRCEATNLPWVMDGAVLGRHSAAPASRCSTTSRPPPGGSACSAPSDFETLQRRLPADGNRALIAAGTGLGEAVIARIGSDWRPLASEGGHADFRPARSARGRAARVDPRPVRRSRELRARALGPRARRSLPLPRRHRSGRGDSRGPRAARERRRSRGRWSPRRRSTDRASGRSPGGASASSRSTAPRPATWRSRRWRSAACSSAAGSRRRMISFLRDGRFVAAFRAKGRLMPLLERIPVRVILDQTTALWGAAAYALARASASVEPTPLRTR